MRFSLGRSLVRILLLALFVTCVGLYVTSGQASAHSAWDSGCNNHGHDNSDSNCSSYDRNDGYGGNYNYDGNDGGSHAYNVSDNCDQWDPKTGYCVHWKLNIPNGPVYDSAYPGNGDNHGGYYYQDNYHDANYYYKYYCDRYGCNCN